MTRLVAALAALLLALAGLLGATATGALAGVPGANRGNPDGAPAGPVGGPLLGSPNLIVDPHSGAKGVPALPAVDAASWLVADLDTGQVLAASNPHGKFAPASTLKTLTALTFIPLLDPAQTIVATNDDAGVDGTKVGVVPGYPYTVHDLFTAMLVMSANDAAHAIARGWDGNLADGIAKMNQVARQLHANDTVAMTPNGLDAPGQSCSAYDLALIARAGMKLPDFARYVSTVRAEFPAPTKPYQIYTHDKLLLRYPGALGIKNGYTIAAKASYVGAAQRNGHRIVITMMRATPDFWPYAQALLDWGFAADGRVAPVGKLVSPGNPTSQSGSAATQSDHGAQAAGRGDAPPSRNVAAATATKDTATGAPVWAWLSLFGIVVVLGLVRLRVRAVRRRQRRFSLPPL